MFQSITIQATVSAPIETVWACWTEPDHITKWAFALDTWEAYNSSNDLKVGGKFSTMMGAKDKSFSFEFGGVYSAVTPNELIEYDLGDGRHVKTTFEQMPDGIHITQTFDAETQNPIEKQREGWQAILNNFKKHAESHA